MKLTFSPTSPFVRKVLVSAMETGLDERIERIDMQPGDPDSGLEKVNPLRKVPAMILDDGSGLFDSPVICEYLDSLHQGRKLFPAAGEARWTALRQQAIADGIADAAVATVGEGRRPKELQSADAVAKQKQKIGWSLDALELEADRLAGQVTIGGIAVACALSYLDLRLAGDEWRKGHPRLAAWHKTFSERPSMQATAVTG